jgi:prepilin-type N-terminal cleavage/methylation domain-containing protein
MQKRMEALNKKRNDGGFTLIELIVVIAVLAILAAVILPKFLGFSEDAGMAAAKSDAKNIATAVEALLAQDEKFEATDTADNGLYGPESIMGYIGKSLGGTLTLTVDDDGLATDFTYKRSSSGKTFEVSYNVDEGTVEEESVADGIIDDDDVTAKQDNP